MGSDFDSFDQSTLGAFIQSTLGARGFESAVAEAIAYYIAAANVTIGTASAANRFVHYFCAGAELANAAGVDADGSPTVVPTDLGYRLNATIDAADSLIAQGNNLAQKRGFDYDGTYATFTTGTTTPTGFAVVDVTGASPNVLWTQSPSNWQVGPVIANGLVIWGVTATSGADEILRMKRFDAATGADQGDVDVTTQTSPDTPAWIAMTATHDRLGLIWEYTEQEGVNNTAYFQRVNTSGVAQASLSALLNDKRAPQGLRTSPDGIAYAYRYQAGESPTESRLEAYNVGTLVRDNVNDFWLNGAGYIPTDFGHSYVTVVGDFAYMRPGNTGTSNYINVIDRAGTLVASMQDAGTVVSALEWYDASAGGQSPTPVLGTLERPAPEFDVLGDQTHNTDTSDGQSPETNLYTRDVDANQGYIGGDDEPAHSLDSGPSGSSIDGTLVKWIFDVTPPVYDAYSDESTSEGTPYLANPSHTISNVHNTTGTFNVSASNRQGSDTESWIVTLSTPVTYSLEQAPAGASLIGSAVFWGSPTLGTHTFEIKATTHVGADSVTWQLEVT